ncbi:MAG: hypothetical protein RJA07_1262 [Bacteroidota bacterium]|jgi:hypothetical protein
MKKYFFFLSILIFIAFSSCERNYDLSGISTLKDKPVVEGYIENGLPPYVFLTKTFSLFGNLSSSNVGKIYIHNAVVSITGSNGQVINLKEYNVPFGKDTISVYTINGLDFSGKAAIKIPFAGLGMVGIDLATINPTDTGHLNTTYKLNISIPAANNLEAAELTAETKIFGSVKLDSVWCKQRGTIGDDTNYVRIYIRRTDNGSTRDFYRYFTQVNNKGLLPGYNSSFNDDFTNGKTYDFPISAGFNKNDTTSQAFKNFGYFKKGDTVTLKLTAIDNDVYDFWQTADNAYSNVGNPFAAPSNVKTNIKGGGIGVWCGYASYHPPIYQRYIIVKGTSILKHLK